MVTCDALLICVCKNIGYSIITMPKKKSKKGKKGKKDKDTAKVERDPVAPDFIIPPPKPRENVSTT